MLDNGNSNNLRINEVFSHIPRAVMHAALPNETLNICHANVQSLCARQLNKFNEFQMCFENSKIDIICITETWLNDNISNEVVAVEGYKLYRHDRSNNRGGGICIYCKNNLHCRVIAVNEMTEEFNDNRTEFLFIEISLNYSKFLLGVFYNPPRNDCSELLEQKMTELCLRYENVVLVGDFNTDMNVMNARTRRFKNVLDAFGMNCINQEPTHFHAGGCSLIDLLLSNNTDFVCNINQVSAPGLSKHDMIFASLNILRSTNTPIKTFRDYAHTNLVALNEALDLNDWNELYSITDPDIAVDMFNLYLKELHDCFVPLKIFKPKSQNNWFNDDIRFAILERDTAYRLWVSTRNQANHDQFKRLRNRVNHIIRLAKANYVSHTVSNSISSKDLWHRLKQLHVVSKPPPTAPTNTCDEINYFFASHFSEPSSTYPFPAANPHGLKFAPLSEHEIIMAIHSIKSNAVGFDDIPLKFIKLILPHITTPLTYIFNLIISTSKFPRAWKLAKIIPIPKKSNGTDLNNLRPISILSTLSKAFEKILKNQIQTFIDNFDLLCPQQSGFRSHHSTTTTLLAVHDDIHQAVDKKGVAFLLMLDFSKAFDRVSHYKLLQKLSSHFFFSRDAVMLIKSYLQERKQAVFIDGQTSEFIEIISGVPQGSVLGPVLFSLFINDLPCVLKFCKIHLFADDVQIYLCSNNVSITELARLINLDLQNIFQWSERNLLPLNPVKSHVMFFNRSRNNPDLLPLIVIDNQTIGYVDKISNLGIIFQNDLKWNSQINSMCSKIYIGLRHLKLSASMLPSALKIRLFKTLLLPHLTYGCELLSNAPNSILRRLRVAVNCCVRWIFNLSYYSRVSHLQPQLLGCSFSNFFKFRCNVALFRIINTSKPKYLYDKLQAFRGTRERNFVLSRFRTSYYGNTLFVRGIVCWNQLPAHIKASQTMNEFRRGCISWLNTGN